VLTDMAMDEAIGAGSRGEGVNGMTGVGVRVVRVDVLVDVRVEGCREVCVEGCVVLVEFCVEGRGVESGDGDSA